MKNDVTSPATPLRSKFGRLASRAGVLTFVAFNFVNEAFAALPTSDAPTKGEGSSLIETLKNYGFDAATLIGLVLCVGGFLAVAYHSVGTYAGIHTGKKTWSDFGLTTTIGALLLVLMIWLITKSADILT